MAANVTVPDDLLEQNCREDWPRWSCIAANICGLTSTTLWFVVLLPQVYKNFRRKSVEGLSILWATANFTASLVNLMFVYNFAKIPLYGRINAVYMPILEFTLLIQFWIYRQEYSRAARLGYAVVCFLVWGILLTVQLLTGAYEAMEWIAITLWCVESFPQVILNMKLRSTSGQSNRSVLVAIIGKMTDFLSTYGLVIPKQYVVMTYFSSSVAYINGIQVAWYFNEEVITEETDSSVDTTSNMSSTINDTQSDVGILGGAKQPPVHWTQVMCCQQNPRRVKCLKFIVIGFLGLDLALFFSGLLWATGSFYSLFAPCAIAAVLLCSYMYYNTSVCGDRVCYSMDTQKCG